MAFLLVYVDDFKLVARAEHQKELWRRLKAVIDMGEEEPESRFLGCKYASFSCTAANVQDILVQHPVYHKRPHLTKEDCNGHFPDWVIDPKRVVKGKTYDMQDFVEQMCRVVLYSRKNPQNLSEAR